MKITEIPLKNIVPSPFQPRETFNKEEINELANSIKKRGTIEPVPKSFQDFDSLQTANELSIFQTSGGYVHRKLQRQGIPVTNPYYLIRADLMKMKNGILQNDPILRKLRGILRTDYIQPDNETGYDPLFPVGEKLQVDIIKRGNFWKDVAVPQLSSFIIDGQLKELKLNRLHHHNKLIEL